MTDVFHGFELLLFRRFQSHPELWVEWRDKLAKKIGDKGTLIDDIEDIGVMFLFVFSLHAVLYTPRH